MDDIHPPEMLQEVFNLDQGPVTLSMPVNLSEQSYQDLQDYFELFLRKAKRRALVHRVVDEHFGDDKKEGE